MTSITDEQIFVDTYFNTIKQIERSAFDELASVVISTIAGILLGLDQSGASFHYRIQNGTLSQRI